MLEIQNRIAFIIEKAERSVLEALIKCDKEMTAIRRAAIKELPEDEPLTAENYNQKYGEYDRIFTEQREEYARINLKIQEITDKATKRYAEKFPTPAAVYDRAEEVVNTFSLTLGRELFPLLGITHSNGKLPNLEKPSELFIRMVFPDKSNREKNISDIFKNFSTHLEIENLKEVCRLKNWKSSRIDELIKEKATELYDAYLEEERLEEQAAAETGIRTVTPNQLPLPLDNLNTSYVFDIDAPEGQISMLPVLMNKAQNLYAFYDLTWADDLDPNIKKKLSSYDQLVYIAAASVQKLNGNIMTIGSIYAAMGNTGDPTPAQRNRILNSIKKMNAAHAEIKCSEERDKYGNVKIKDYYGSLFPMVMVRERVNGQVVDGAIKILEDKLPLISFAEARNQIDEVPIYYLTSSLNQTDKNVAMELYVLETIKHIKNPKSSKRNKILYKQIYKLMEADNRVKQQRARNALFTYLDELKDKGFINGYKEETTPSTGEVGVKFFYDKEDK